jgi:hypothetical protein
MYISMTALLAILSLSLVLTSREGPTVLGWLLALASLGVALLAYSQGETAVASVAALVSLGTVAVLSQQDKKAAATEAARKAREAQRRPAMERSVLVDDSDLDDDEP